MAASVDDGAPMKMTVFEQSAADVVVKNIPLTKGAHRVRLNSMTGGIRINYLKLEIVRGK
jgi:hypothetical protein